MLHKWTRYAQLRSALAITATTTVAFAPSAHAEPVSSRTPDITWITASDIGRFTPVETANAFTLAEPATVRSVTWRGAFADGVEADPDLPVAFTINIYTDDSGAPGSAVLSDSITLSDPANVVDTGLTTVIGGLTRYIYELQTDITPTALAAGTTYWFSPVADTPDDLDNFYWGLDAGTASASTSVNGGAWTAAGTSDYYFILDDAPIPEPSSLALLTLGGLALARRRRG